MAQTGLSAQIRRYPAIEVYGNRSQVGELRSRNGLGHGNGTCGRAARAPWGLAESEFGVPGCWRICRVVGDRLVVGG